MTRVAAVLMLAACGNDHARAGAADAPAAAIDAAPAACTGAFSGNFSEQVALPADCASWGSDGALAFSVPSQTLGVADALSFSLGSAASPGSYSEDSVATWSALATMQTGNMECIYVAGSMQTTPGSFALTVTAFDAAAATAHGQLTLEQNVLATSATDCGSDDLESVTLMF